MKHLVFVGGGHAHLSSLAALDKLVKRGHRVTLVSPDPFQYYSGMGPGMLGGTYSPAQISFNVKRLVEDRGGLFIQDRVLRIDPDNRMLHRENGPDISYDVVSFNIGSQVSAGLADLSGENIFTVKPIKNLVIARQKLINALGEGRQRIVVVGGGPAGLEIAGNLRKLVRETGGRADIKLVAGRRLMDRFPGRVRRLALRSLNRMDIEVVEGRHVDSVGKGRVSLSGGETMAFDFLLVSTGVKPPPVFTDSGLPTGSDGGLLVNRFLQSVSYPEIFGGGDCINLEGFVLEKVGVYAVRQNPVLKHNLRAALEGGEPMEFEPGGAFLLLFNTGDGRAIFHKKGVVFAGRPVFWLKDYIDRRFMRTFQVSGERAERRA